MATYTLTLGSEEHELEVEEQDSGYRVKLGDTWYQLELERMGDSARYSLLLDKHPTDVFAEEGPNSYHIVIGTRSFAVTTGAYAGFSMRNLPSSKERNTPTYPMCRIRR